MQSGTATLATETQRDKEILSLRLLASAPMQRELNRLEALYRADVSAGTPSGLSTIRRAVDSTAMAAAEYAANEDTDRPTVLWDTNAPHTWFGLNVPGSGYAIDNPDNVYRTVSLNGAARYEVYGKIKYPAPAQQTFMLYSSIPGVTPTMNKAGHMMELGFLDLNKMSVAPDGTFTIIIDSAPADGRPNHIKSQADNPNMLLLVRDTLANWATENVVALDVRRVAGPPLRPVPKEEILSERAAEILSKLGAFFLNWSNNFVYKNPVNQITTPWARATGWGYASFGSFALADDEAWVVTLDALGAAYFAFQLADPWGIAVAYTDRNGSLNHNQMRANVDGTYTYVIAAQDPGVYNWLDSAGLLAGMFTARWQGMPPHVTSPDGLVRSTQIVKLKSLKDALPPETVFISPSERKSQLAERAASYQRRLVN